MTKPTHRHNPINGPGHGIIVFLLLLPTADAQFSGGAPPAGPYTSASFNPSMAIIVVILITALFFMGFFSVYLRQCGRDADDSAAAGRIHRGTPWGRSRRSRGLDQAVIETFPTLAYSDVKGLKLGKTALECAVCLSEFQDDDTLRLLPKCSHVFHPECIDAWLASKSTCPVCRCNLVPDPDAPTRAGDSSVLDPLPGAGVEEQQAAGAPLPDHVAVDVEETVKSDEPVDLSHVGGKNRLLWRSWSALVPGKLPRSESTGHAVVQPGEDVERFTLRLPEYVRKELLARRLQRSKSCLAYTVTASEGSCKRGYRGDGSNRGSGGRSLKLGGSRSVGGRSFKMGRREWSDRWSIVGKTFSFGVSKAEGEESIRRGEGSTTAHATATASRAGEGGGGSTRGEGVPSQEDDKLTTGFVPRV